MYQQINYYVLGCQLPFDKKWSWHISMNIDRKMIATSNTLIQIQNTLKNLIELHSNWFTENKAYHHYSRLLFFFLGQPFENNFNHLGFLCMQIPSFVFLRCYCLSYFPSSIISFTSILLYYHQASSQTWININKKTLINIFKYFLDVGFADTWIKFY